MTYCTYDDVVAESNINTTKITAADVTYLKRTLRTVSDTLAKLSSGAGYDLEPWYATVKVTPRPTNVNTTNKTLVLPRLLLELDTLTVDGTALTENTDVYAEPLAVYPIRALRIDPDSDTAWYPSTSSDPFNTIVLTGWWGFRRRYDSEGFLSVDTVQNAAGLTAGGTSLTVADVDGADPWGLTPRISYGSLLRIEEELVEVTATDTTANTATIRRAVHDTAAVAHAKDTVVKAWFIEPEIRHVAARHVGLIYARRSAYQQVVTEFGSTSYPADLVTEARAAIQRLMYA